MQRRETDQPIEIVRRSSATRTAFACAEVGGSCPRTPLARGLPRTGPYLTRGGKRHPALWPRQTARARTPGGATQTVSIGRREERRTATARPILGKGRSAECFL